MSPRTPKQFEEIRESRKLQIMQVALEVFASEGYQSVSIARIAKKAGISKGLLYNYFLSKEDLLNSILLLGLQKFHDILNQFQDELDTPEELMSYIQGGFELIRKEPEFYRLSFSVLFQPGVAEAAQSRYREMVAHLSKDISFYFETMGDPNPAEKAMLLGKMIESVGLLYSVSPTTVDLDKMENIIFELFK